jgi:hypothetical protein
MAEVQGSRFRVQGSGFRVHGFREQGSGIRKSIQISVERLGSESSS